MSRDPSDNESERRRRVADEKMWGAIIEAVEKMRKERVARSIMFRLFNLYQLISDFQKTVKAMGEKVDPSETRVPLFSMEQTNFLIRTYNSIIEDLHSHLGKKDSHVHSFSPVEQLDTPFIEDVAKTLYEIGTTTSQIITYLSRWI